jgi:hypothetical protein
VKGRTAFASSGNMEKPFELAQRALKMTAPCARTDREGYTIDQEASQDFMVKHDEDQRMRQTYHFLQVQ